MPAVLALFLVLAADAGSMGPDDIEASLEVNKDRSYGILSVTGTVPFRKDYVWYVLTAPCSSRCTHTDDIIDFTITNKGADTYEAYYMLDFPWPLENRWIRSELKYRKASYRIEWRRIDGTIRHNAGFYELAGSGSRTTIRYRSEFDPGIRFVPRWIINYVVKSQSKKIIGNIRKCLDMKEYRLSYEASTGQEPAD